MHVKLHVGAMVKAGALTGVILYLLCLAFYLLVYGGTGAWMIRPFMPGVTNSIGGYILALAWSVFYGAGIPWLLAVLYNRFVRDAAGGTGGGGA